MFYIIFQLYTLRKLNQGDAADPRAPLGKKKLNCEVSIHAQ